MNKYTYQELSIGKIESFERVITEDMMKNFEKMSGDINPLHCDEKFAQGKGFRSRVVYGMLVASLYSCLAGVYLPGEKCLLQSINVDFCKPVFIGDILTVTGKLIEKNDSVQQLIIKGYIKNQNGEKVSRVKIEAGVL